MGFVGAGGWWFWFRVSSGCGGLGLGLPVVVPVAECANHVHCGLFAFVPLSDVGGFEAGGLGASLPVALDGCASVVVAGEACFPYRGGDVGGAVVFPGHTHPRSLLEAPG